MKKSLKILAVLGGLVVLVGVAWLKYVDSVGPETYVVSGKQTKKRHLARLRALGLLGSDETVQYFYSDAFADIEAGLYFVTDKKLVVYCNEWEEPACIVAFDQIEDLEFEHNPSFFEDSSVQVDLTDGMSLSFPLSSERGGDQQFFGYLEKRWRERIAGAGDPKEEKR